MKARLMEFEQQVMPQLNEHLKQVSKKTADATLQQAMDYSLLAGGKRIRPLLLLATASSFGRQLDDASFQVAVSLEMVHTYSLIHDDLPAMDNDDMRRNQPTNHKKFGAGMATLAGDALLTDAFLKLSQANLLPQSTLKLVNLLAAAAGSLGMCAGQAKDLLGETKQFSLAELVDVHLLKTAALLTYACQAGGILGGANDAQLAQLAAFGKHFGLAFQIYDDLLDERQDQVEHKNSYVSLLGAAGASQKLRQQIAACQTALATLAKSGMDESLLVGLLDYFENGTV